VLNFVWKILGDPLTPSPIRSNDGMSNKPPTRRRWLTLLGIAVLLLSPKQLLGQLPHPETFILEIVLVVMTAWLIGRLRTSR